METQRSRPEAIRKAALCMLPSVKRHPHQRRIPRVVLEQAEARLQAVGSSLAKAADIEALHRLRKPRPNQFIYTRRNGSFLLEITAYPRFGLPYGQDRLIPIWLATLAHR